MSDNDDKKNDKKSGSDPYDFFKLSSEPGDSNKGGKGKGPKIPFWAIIIIIIAITGILNVLLVPRQENLIAFSEFKSMIENGQIVSVDIGETYFTGYMAVSKENVDMSITGSLFKTPGKSESVKTAGILTESFLTLLDDKGVTYKIIAKQNSFFMQLLLNLIIPFGFIFLMWFLIFRKISCVCDKRYIFADIVLLTLSCRSISSFPAH